MSRIRFPPDGKFGKGIDKKVCFLYLAWATKGYAYFDTMERKNRKIYYTMWEVSEMFDVNPSLIRFWEQKFDILKPDKNKKGNRLFTPKDVENLKLIYHLVKENGMTLAGAAKRLRDNREGVERNLEIIEKLQGMRALLLEVREELKSGGDEIFIDTSVPETATAAPSLQTDAAAVPDAPPAAEESVEGPAVPRFLQREIPIPPQPATAAPRFGLPEEAARTEEPTATPEPEQPRRPVIVEQSLF